MLKNFVIVLITFMIIGIVSTPAYPKEIYTSSLYSGNLMISSPTSYENEGEGSFTIKGKNLMKRFQDIAIVIDNENDSENGLWIYIDATGSFEEEIILPEAGANYFIKVMMSESKKNSYYSLAEFYVTNTSPYDRINTLYQYYGNVVITSPLYNNQDVDGSITITGTNFANEYDEVVIVYTNQNTIKSGKWTYITKKGYFSEEFSLNTGPGHYYFKIYVGPNKSGSYYEVANFSINKVGDNLETIYIEDDVDVEENETITVGDTVMKGWVKALTDDPPTYTTTYGGNYYHLYPLSISNTADGFVYLRGINLTNDYDIIAYSVTNLTAKAGKSDFTGQGWSYISNAGYFDETIFLRSGPGWYEIQVKVGPTDRGTYYTVTTFYVKNTATVDNRYILPSGKIQSMDPTIVELSDEIAEDSSTDREKVLAIHDWVIKYLDYDMESARNSTTRKGQDALSVLDNEMAVCEGYTSLFLALVRAQGIPGKYVIGDADGAWGWDDHAWAEVYYDGEWHNIDVTYDDPGSFGSAKGDKDGSNLRYDYFEISDRDLAKDHLFEKIYYY